MMAAASSLTATHLSARPTVFLAEDDPELRRILAEGLRESGFDVIAATDGRDLLRLLTAASRREVPMPDVFVMDIRMPRCSGLDVLGALRLAEWNQPVVLITGFGEPTLHATAAEYGASIILDKPVDIEDLASTVDILLRVAEKQRATTTPSAG